MQPFTIKYHRLGAAAPPSAFFILFRGRHTGRPAFTPNPNSFVFICAPQDSTCYYWLVYALWYSHSFEPILCGTCIEFAHIDDIRRMIADRTSHITRIAAVLPNLQKIQAAEIRL